MRHKQDGILDERRGRQKQELLDVEKLNWATRLTLLRISLTPLLAVFLYYNNISLAFFIFILAMVTDGLDGYIARVYNQKTWLGSFLDPIADKLLALTSFILLTFSAQIALRIPAWVTIIIVFRDIFIVLGAAITLIIVSNWVVKPTFLGKMNTVFQFFTILYAMTANLLIKYGIDFKFNSPVLNSLAYTTLFFSIISGILYLRSGAKLLLGIQESKQDSSTNALK